MKESVEEGVGVSTVGVSVVIAEGWESECSKEVGLVEMGSADAKLSVGGGGGSAIVVVEVVVMKTVAVTVTGSGISVERREREE